MEFMNSNHIQYDFMVSTVVKMHSEYIQYDFNQLWPQWWRWIQNKFSMIEINDDQGDGNEFRL